MTSRILRALTLGAALAVPLGALPLGARAQTSTAQTSTAWTPAPLFAPSQIVQTTLPNGVRAVIEPNAQGADLVSIQIWVRGGSSAEKRGEEGLAHLIEIAAVSASKNNPGADSGDEGGLSGAIRTVGGESGSLTSRDSTFYSATVASADWGRALSALADTVLQPDLSGSNVGSAKLQIANQLVGKAFNAAAAVSDLAYEKAFPLHPYGHSSIGAEDVLGGLTPAKARAFYARQYVGQNISVIIVGRVPADAATDAVKRLFADASKAAPPSLDFKTAPLPDERAVSEKAPVARDAVALAWRSPGIKTPRDVVAMDTLLALWREGLDANLRRVLLRDGEDGDLKPLVESYDVDYLTQRDMGLVLITLAGVEDRDETIKAVEAEVARLRDQGPTPAELQRAKKLLHDQYVEQSEGPAGQAGALGFYEMIATYQFAVDYLALTETVTAADVQRIAGEYLATDKEVRATVDPLPRPGPGKPANPDDADGGDGVITASLPHNSPVAQLRVAQLPVARLRVAQLQIAASGGPRRAESVQ